MNIDGLRCFLSEENIRLHLTYLDKLRARLSVLRKSEKELIGRPSEKRLSRGISEQIRECSRAIRFHECYFNSFTDRPSDVGFLKKYSRSAEALIYELFCLGMKSSDGFLYLYKDRKGSISIGIATKNCRTDHLPILALDLAEHSYFWDYGFDKRRYLRSALSHFDMNKC